MTMIRKVGKQTANLARRPHIRAVMAKTRLTLHSGHEEETKKVVWWVGTAKRPITPGFYTLVNLERHCQRRGFLYGMTTKHVAKAKEASHA